LQRNTASSSTDRQHDWAALLALAILFLVMLVVTWQRWTQPIIDHGREMHVPVRILEGDRLYVDIMYHYGPFAAYFNALLYYLFGIHLNVLHASGLVCAVLILGMIYWLARRLMPAWEAALATSLVLITCALSGFLGNFIQPYAYAALYGWTFALGSLVCAAQFVTSHRGAWLCWAGAGVGATMACKPDYGLLVAAPTGVAWLLACASERRWLWRPAWLAVVSALAVGALAYGPIVMTVPWRTQIAETYELFNQPQLVYFARFLNGSLGWPTTGWALLSAAGMSLGACGLAALLGLLLDQRVQGLLRREAVPGWISLVAGGGLWAIGGGGSFPFDVTPIRSAPLVLGLTIGILAWGSWRRYSRSEPLPAHDQVALLIAIFSVIAIGRVFLNISLWSPYTSFSVPTVLVVYCYLFFRAAPLVMLSSARARDYARVVAMALVAIWVTSLGIEHADSARLNRFEISAPRGRFLTEAAIGQPLADAIRFASARTQPGDAVLSLPQGSIINFLADRRNPLREEILIPGLLPPDREADAIRRAEASRVKLILVSNHLTPEYRDWAFGVHYNQAFMQWINAHYHPVATFSATRGRPLQFGGLDFFIQAYERNGD
jgi:hypothetical protein